MPPGRTSKYWRRCPNCGEQKKDLRLYNENRSWFKCGGCGHVWHPENKTQCETVPKEKKEGKTVWDKLFGGD